MFLSLALLPRHLRRKPGNLVNIALLPRYLKRHHGKVSDIKAASLKRWLTWAAMDVVLQELLQDPHDGPLPKYRCVRCNVLL